MKKFLIILLVFSLCVGAVAALIGYRNHMKQEALLQASIAAFENGDLETASSSFKTLMEETDDPDMETVYRFIYTLQLWQSEDTNKKLQAFDRIQYTDTAYDGILADAIRSHADVISREGAKLKAEVDAQREEELLRRITEGKPYVGMDSKYISMTSLGAYDKTDYNKKKIGNKDHRCTLYYWMEGSRCIFIARVQDDIHEVINIDANPTGSYFGN